MQCSRNYGMMGLSTRRQLLRVLSAGSAAALAGCGTFTGSGDAPPTTETASSDQQTPAPPDGPPTWPTFQYDAQNSGTVGTGLDVSNSATERWTYRFEFDADETSDGAFSSPVVGTELAYVGAPDGTLYALDRADGTLAWSFDAGGIVPSTPVLSDGTLYVASGTTGETVFALDVATGDVRWSTGEAGPVEVPLTVADGIVYVGDADGTFHALDADAGDVRWQIDEGITGAPAVGSGTVFVATGQSELLALEAESGAVEWTATPSDSGAVSLSAPTLASDVAYVGGGNVLSAYGTSDGEQLWEYDTGVLFDSRNGGNLLGSVALEYGAMFAPTDAGTVHRIAASSRQLEDAEVFDAPDGPIESSPIIVDGMGYVGSTDHSVYAFGAGDLETYWEYETTGEIATTPAVAGSALFVVSEDGAVHALELES